MRSPVPTLLALVAATGLAAAASAVEAQTVEEARTALRAGAYDDALRAFARADRASDDPAVTRERVRALLEVARYAEALEVVGGPGGAAPDPALENVRGEALRSVGRWEEAEAAFRRAVEAGAPDREVARKNLAVLLWDRGEREEALRIFDGFIDLYNAGGRLDAEELMAVGTAVRYLGTREPALFQDALMAYDEAAAVDPGDPRPALLAGELFLEKYNGTDARASFTRVLEANPHHPRGLLGRARALDFAGEPGVLEPVRRGLEVAPDHPDLRAFLARQHLRVRDFDRAREEAERALAVDSRHLGALSLLGAAHYLRGDSAAWREIRSRVQAVSPGYPGLYVTVAELAVDQRKYHAAVELAGRAVELDSTAWDAWGIRGINRLRTGEVEAGRADLERAFEGDPYNVWFSNTLDLLDTFHRYETIRTEHFELFLHGEEAALLGPYLAELAEEAYAVLRERYGGEPPTPIRVELFPSHADFSVRSLGLTGLGALGVSFGSTLVMDSPSAREPGAFNWASTFWHELAHAFHLGLTDHNVPRWFSEGLAVHEQRTARSRWGPGVSPAWLQAYAAGRLHDLPNLDEGFVRPDYPQQVGFSYVQASLVFQMIEERWGFGAILRMLEGYRDGRATEAIVPAVLGMDMEALDGAFDGWMEARWGDRIEAVATTPGDGPAGPGADLAALRRQATRQPGSFPARLALGQALREAGRLDEAEAELRAALRLFPEYGGPDGPLLHLARIHRERGETEAAADALRQLGERNETALEAHREEAALRRELGQPARAAEALERAVEIFPYDPEVQRELGTLLEETGRFDRAALAYRAVLALEPVDRAGAHYDLARALHRAGRSDEARSEILRALEIAPGFPEALELLLEIRGTGTSPDGGGTR